MGESVDHFIINMIKHLLTLSVVICLVSANPLPSNPEQERGFFLDIIGDVVSNIIPTTTTTTSTSSTTTTTTTTPSTTTTTTSTTTSTTTTTVTTTTTTTT